MIRDITIGQFFPGKSALHRMDPRAKLVLLIVYIVMIFVASNFCGLGLSAAFLVGTTLLSKVPIKTLLKSIRPLLIVILFTALINIFYVDGNTLVQWGIFRITDKGIFTAIFMAVRIVLLVLGGSVLTYTTSPTDLTDGLERLLSPLSKIRLPVHELAMMMSIALRFIPTLLEETDKIMAAQKARGADMESGGLMQRVKALIPILIPLFVSAIRRAYDLAIAMECRCYRGGEGRTRIKQLHLGSVDAWGILVTAVCLGGVVALKVLLPSTL